MAPSREDIPALIAKKQYSKAIDLLKAQLHAGRPDDRTRLQLADVLVLAGKGREAVTILSSLADEYARDGFAAKAISVLKKIEKIDPGRRDVGGRLAALIEAKQKQATIPAPPPPAFEIGMEEIGFDAGSAISVNADEPAPLASPRFEDPEPELSMEAAPFSVEEVPALQMEEEVQEPVIEAVAPPRPEPVVDQDLVSLEDADLVLEPEAPEITLEPEALEPEAEPDMSEADFGQELLALVDEAFSGTSEIEESPAPEGSQQIVVSPLFKDFSVDELVAVMQGLTLLSFDAGDIVISEGDPGDSLYMLSTGTVKVLKKNTSGKQISVGMLGEGAFFGEGSILTGRPRTASVVATTRCELLELDRGTLDGIVKSHPRVLEILKEFARQRSRPSAPPSRR